jgi:alpha-D-xyloside xylohydrolase
MGKISLRQWYMVVALCAVQALIPIPVFAQQGLSALVSHAEQGRSMILTGEKGERLRLTPYGDFIVRVQAVRRGEEFFDDDRYEMVEPHRWPGFLTLVEEPNTIRLTTNSAEGVIARVSKAPMRISFSQTGDRAPFLQELEGIGWRADTIRASFRFDPNEHFTGLGHGYYAREEKLDLRGEVVRRNYGTEHGQQAPLLVPFFLSSKGYGVFLNSTFPNTFDFGKDGLYEFSIAGDGRMDYFVILGPGFRQILDRYTQLTGRPRLPPRAIFGLALSDKGNDHTSPAPSDESWWKAKIAEHRKAGFPLDHIVNDNRWRAGGGTRCESFFDWDPTRYPDPAEYERWILAQGLITTLDFNRCIASRSDLWNPSFNIPRSDSIDFGHSAPDFTRKEVRAWFWNLMWRKSLNPALAFPGDALWIDEFDEMGKTPVSMVCGNGRTWREMRNYWFFLIAKSLVQEGWDTDFHGTKRPFVWVRGMTAGGQRYATLWSGDIKPTYADMRRQVRGMQLAGLSGFPFWGHDAGGFYDWEGKKGPDDAMYRQWSMAFGSFTPFWKPHGVGQSRWPLDRSPEAQNTARLFCALRYSLMPYTYTYAHDASASGLPLARAMVVEHQNDPLAWKYDLQYMWGDRILVAPNCSDGDSVNVWLPGGVWFDLWSEARLEGNRVITVDAPTGYLPLFVKAGSIIPMAPAAMSTAFMRNDSLTIHVFPGRDAEFVLYEDDGRTEAYRGAGGSRSTTMSYVESTRSLTIAPATGHYEGEPGHRVLRIDFHGYAKPVCFEVNGVLMKQLPQKTATTGPEEGTLWEAGVMSVFLKPLLVTSGLSIRAIPSCP